MNREEERQVRQNLVHGQRERRDAKVTLKDQREKNQYEK